MAAIRTAQAKDLEASVSGARHREEAVICR